MQYFWNWQHNLETLNNIRYKQCMVLKKLPQRAAFRSGAVSGILYLLKQHSSKHNTACMVMDNQNTNILIVYIRVTQILRQAKPGHSIYFIVLIWYKLFYVNIQIWERWNDWCRHHNIHNVHAALYHLHWHIAHILSVLKLHSNTVGSWPALRGSARNCMSEYTVCWLCSLKSGLIVRYDPQHSVL